jgi:hypothetical protein
MANRSLLGVLVELFVMKKAIFLSLVIVACTPNPSSSKRGAETAGDKETEKLPPPIKLGNVISFKCDGLSTEKNAYKIVEIKGTWVHLQEFKKALDPLGSIYYQFSGEEPKYQDVGWFAVERMNNIIAIVCDSEGLNDKATKTGTWKNSNGIQVSNYIEKNAVPSDAPRRGVYSPADNPDSKSVLVSPTDQGKTCIVVMRPKSEWAIVDWNIVLNGRQYDSIKSQSFRILEIQPGKYDMTCGAMGVGTHIYFTAYPGTTLFITAEWERFVVLPIEEGETLFRSMQKSRDTTRISTPSLNSRHAAYSTR